MDGSQWCASCYRPRGPGEYACARCECDVYTRSIPEGATVELEELSSDWTGGLFAGLTKIPAGYAALLSGEPGTGKTTAALTAFPRPQYLALETSGLLAAAYVQRLKVAHGGIFDRSGVSHVGMTVEERLNLKELRPGYVVVDSLKPFGAAAGEALHAVMAWCGRTGGRAVCIQHATKDGEISGALSLQHDAECTIWLKRRADGRIEARTLKSRWAPLRSVVFELDRPRFPLDRYASVEGPVDGPYDLVPWPPVEGRAPRWAGAYELTEQRTPSRPKLPPPPLAIACQRSRLYPRGLVDAPDIDARAAYAAELGVPFARVEDLFDSLPEEEA